MEQSLFIFEQSILLASKSGSIMDGHSLYSRIKSWLTASARLSAGAHWLQTHNHIRLVMVVVADGRTDRQTPEGAQEYTLLQEYYFCGTPTEKV